MRKKDDVAGKSLSRVVMLYLIVFIFLFSGIILYWSYQSSTSLISRELQAAFSQRQINAENSIDHIFVNLEESVSHIATDTLLGNAVSALDTVTTKEVLKKKLGTTLNSNLDILFIRNNEGKVWVDESSPFFNLRNVLSTIADTGVIYDIPGQLFIFPREQSELIILGRSMPLIQEKTGRVVGTLFGGIILNDNIFIAEYIRREVQVDSLLILNEKRVIVSTKSVDTPLVRAAMSHLDVDNDEFRKLGDGYIAHYKKLHIGTQPAPLELVLIVKDTIFSDLNNSYQSKIFLFVLLVIGVSIITLFFVRHLLTSPLEILFSYATQIGKDSPVVYRNGPISEFNQIGIVMGEMVFSLQQNSEQLKDEIIMRQQAMNDLEVHRASLEDIVEKRTKELSVTNKNLQVRNQELDLEKTERLQAEDEMQKLAEAVKNSPVSIMIADGNGLIEYVNPKFSELTGYSSEEVVGKNPRILQSGIHPKQYYKEMWERLISGREWHGEFCNKNKNGTIFWELASISPISDKNGKIKHFVAVKEDITKRKMVEDSLKEARQKAEEASEQKSMFLANMSHEIRTPMNALIGLSELALETRLTDQQYDYLNKIHMSSKGLLTILNDILDYSKIEAGKLELENRLCSLSDFINEIENLFREQAIQKGVEFNVSVDNNIPTYLYGDASRMRQILINLVGNALKFTHQGKVEIKLALFGQTDKQVQLKFSIIDSGIGIPKGKIEKIFKAFNQMDVSHTRKYGGTGLGLPISKQLIDMMGGQLEVKSEEGKGSEFFFILNCKKGTGDEVSLLEQKKSLEDRKNASIHQLTGIRVLLVEDNLINQQIVTEFLARANVEITIAVNGEDAVEKYAISLRQMNSFAAILMDIQMPLLDGYKATDQIRALEASQSDIKDRVPIIAMTAHNMAGDREKGIAAGMDDYIAKPVSSAELFITLAKWVKKKIIVEKVGGGVSPQSVTQQEFSLKTGLPANMPGICLQEGIDLLEGNTELYLRLLKDFFDQFHKSSSEIEELLKNNAYDSVRQLAHTVKGVASSLCVHGIEEEAAKLEIAITEENNPEDLLVRFSLAWQEMLESINFLEEKGCFMINKGLLTRKQDKVAFSRLLANLLTRIDKMDFQAARSWEELKLYLPHDVKSDKISQIDHCITSFDFKNARELITFLVKGN